MSKQKNLIEASQNVTFDTSGNVGIGTSSPSDILDVASTTDGDPVRIRLTANDDGGTTRSGNVFFDPDTNTMGFRNGGSDRLHVDSSGNLLVGKASTGILDDGFEVSSEGRGAFTRDNGPVLFCDRGSSSGDIIRIRKDNSNVGNIGTRTAGSAEVLVITFDNGGFGVGFTGTSAASHALLPADNGATADNLVDLGVSSVRFDDIYATNASIQTSDQNEKQQIASLTTAEMDAAKAISGLFKTFKWNDSVAEKGDAARTHAGVIAQEVEAVMTDAGLNAGDYAFFISDTWWETQTDVPAVVADPENDVEAQDAYTRTDTYDTAEEAPEGATERTRKGIRYPELLSFVGAATEQRLADIETRLAALEAV